MYKTRLGECMDGATKGQFGYMEIDPSGRYGRFREILGKGAVKTVYKAFDEVLGMEVAWNQVRLNDVFRSPDELQRLYSEVHLLKTLDHDSILKLYTSWIDVERRTFNFITEMLTSGTLREYRQKYKRVDIRAVKNWSRQILRGLAYLHGRDTPVIHRDLKCDNIFVNGHLGQVKIGDLGLAAILRGSKKAHSVIGTPEFMAPELYEEEYNELVDIYSFGMCVLEMVTSEYPYSECSNPAQIYKKVTSGKLPEAFYRIQDGEAQKFVGKCLAAASKRLSAKELLLDPFLASDDGELLPTPKIPSLKSTVNGGSKEMASLVSDPARSTNMTIKGSLNPDDDTIFLKVQITDKNGHSRNIYFPFDTVNDTVIDVATEMVEELEITDWEPSEIAEMIEHEVSALIPTWNKEWGSSQNHHQHSFSYEEEEEDDDDGTHHPFYSFSSSSSSSQASLSGLSISPEQSQFLQGNNLTSGHDWFQDDLFLNDDTSSQSSQNSCNYSNLNYSSADENDFHTNPKRGDPLFTTKTHKSTRFCPEDRNSYMKCNVMVDSQRAVCKNQQRNIAKTGAFMDVRSQLLHRSLVEELNKRRMFKTVGAVENIGFQAPSGGW